VQGDEAYPLYHTAHEFGRGLNVTLAPPSAAQGNVSGPMVRSSSGLRMAGVAITGGRWGKRLREQGRQLVYTNQK
jgi:hypothetical protein